MNVPVKLRKEKAEPNKSNNAVLFKIKLIHSIKVVITCFTIVIYNSKLKKRYSLVIPSFKVRVKLIFDSTTAYENICEDLPKVLKRIP